jgi:hypothetical protein
MKFGKDEIQKMLLGGLLLIGVIYSYFNFLLGPLAQRQAAVRKSVAEMEPAIASAKLQIKRTENMEAAAPGELALVNEIGAMIPEGSPVAWFPPRIGDFFKKQGVDKAATRMNSDNEDKSLPGFRRISWGVDLPKVDFVPFAAALAQLENEEPLLQIASMQVDSSRDEVESQHVMMTVQNIVKQ